MALLGALAPGGLLAPPALSWAGALLAMVLGAATLEGLVRQFVLGRAYDWRAFAASLADAAGRRVVGLIDFSVATPVLALAHEHRLATIALDTGWQWLALLLLHELAYYAYHRSAHRVRWFWATHSVHHSPDELTLATALRLGWTGKLTGTVVFFAPLLWIGFSPLAVFCTLAVNLLYQFWLHTTWIPRLGPLEWVFNTPSHHRVHHASNPEYLDCNYGGVLIVYDRLFGTFVAERDDIVARYGLTTPLRSYNPVRIALHEWRALGRDLAAAASWREALRAVFGPPGGRQRAAPGAAASERPGSSAPARR